MRLAAAALTTLALIGALAFAGCGGGDSATTTSETTSAAAKPETKAPEPRPQRQKPSSGDSAVPAPAEPHGSVGAPVPGAKAPAPGVPVTPEGDNSVQTFGAEGETDPREQATATLKDYLMSKAAGEWARACAATSEEFKRELATMIERAHVKGDVQKPEGCVETLEVLFGEAPKATLESAAQVGEVLSFRVKDDGYAYLIFKGAGGATKFIAMANDDGTWKVNTFEPAEFSAAKQGSSQ